MTNNRLLKHELTPEAIWILDEVLEKMQEAENIGGPEGPAYVQLMIAIAEECQARIKNCVSWHWQKEPRKPKMLTFQEFQKTGRNVRFNDDQEHISEFGRVYDGGCYIGLLDDGSAWHLLIEQSEWTDTDLAKLEKRLYEDWYVHEVHMS